MATASLNPSSNASLLLGLFTGALLLGGAGVVWWHGDVAMLSAADAARASLDPTREVLIEGVLVPDSEGPLFHSPASGEAALAYELLYFSGAKKPHAGDDATGRVDRQFASMPLVVRAGDRRYEVHDVPSAVFTRDQVDHAFLAPQRWFPAQLRRTHAGRPFTVREARLEPGDAIAVRGRLDAKNGAKILQRDGALEVWDGGVAPFERTRSRHNWGAIALALAGLAAINLPILLARRKPKDPYEGWKVFK